MSQPYWGERSSGYVELDATGLTIVSSDSGPLAWMGANIGCTDYYMPVETGRELYGLGGEDGAVTAESGARRCRYCGVRSNPHTDAGRALMCPACGAPM